MSLISGQIPAVVNKAIVCPFKEHVSLCQRPKQLIACFKSAAFGQSFCVLVTAQLGVPDWIDSISILGANCLKEAC